MFVRTLTLLFTILTLAPPLKAVQADELLPAPEGTFSIAVIPDTQHYRGSGTKKEPNSSDSLTNPVFETLTEWIAGNLDQQRIVFVSHVGDIVDKNNQEQWALARECMDKLHGKVPYGISVGNHDMTGKSGDSSLFQEVFPQSRYTDFEWYAGCFEPGSGSDAVSGNNANSVQLFEAAGMKFVALHLECNAPDDVLEWADSVLKEHSDRRAMITTHMGLGPRDRPQSARDYFDAPKGRMQWKKCHGDHGNTPHQMWDKCFKKHANLFLICCGDQSRTQAYHQSSVGENGNVVHEVLSDYGTSGLRLMRFIPQENRIEIKTWNPMKSKLCFSTKIVPDANEHQFSLPYTMSMSHEAVGK